MASPSLRLDHRLISVSISEESPEAGAFLLPFLEEFGFCGIFHLAAELLAAVIGRSRHSRARQT